MLYIKICTLAQNWQSWKQDYQLTTIANIITNLIGQRLSAQNTMPRHFEILENNSIQLFKHFKDTVTVKI